MIQYIRRRTRFIVLTGNGFQFNVNNEPVVLERPLRTFIHDVVGFPILVIVVHSFIRKRSKRENHFASRNLGHSSSSEIKLVFCIMLCYTLSVESETRKYANRNYFFLLISCMLVSGQQAELFSLMIQPQTLLISFYVRCNRSLKHDEWMVPNRFSIYLSASIRPNVRTQTSKSLTTQLVKNERATPSIEKKTYG